MNTITRLLDTKAVLLADGAWGTELQTRGLRVDGVPEYWNVDHEDEVRTVARAYASIPVDVLTTNTFGAHRVRAGKNVALLNQRGVTIGREEAGGAGALVASIGPISGAGIRERETALEEQLDALQAAGATACVFETQLDVREGAAAVSSARARGMDAVASFTFFREGAGALHTRCGSTPARAAAAVLDAGALATGANCCDGPETVCMAVTQMAAAHPGAVLWAKPNAGVPERVAGAFVYPETPEAMAAWALRIADAGARIIGGCCGCGPDHIAAMATALRGTTRP